MPDRHTRPSRLIDGFEPGKENMGQIASGPKAGRPSSWSIPRSFVWSYWLTVAPCIEWQFRRTVIYGHFP